METISSKKFLQTWLWALTIVSVLAILQTVQRTNELEIILLRSKWIGLVGVFAITVGAGIWLSFSPFLDRIVTRLEQLKAPSSSILRITYYTLIVFAFLFVFITRLYIFGSILPQTMPILWVFLWASLIQSVALKLLRKLEWSTSYTIIVLTQGFIFQT